MKKKVLIVDDDLTIINVYKRVLAKNGYEPIVMRSPRKADLENIPEVDIAIVDMVMPYVSGFDFVLYLHEKKINIPVLIVSGDKGIARMVTTIRRGELTDGWLYKPVAGHQLIAKIEEILS